MRNLFYFLTIFTTVFLIGCGGGGLATNKVTGTVTVDGEPLANASITFTPKTQGVGHPGYGTTDEKGVYLLQTSQGQAEAGTTPGDYLVAIRKSEVDPDAPPPAPGYPPVTRSVIPVRYAQTSTSGLVATVENKRSNEINFELTSE
jgi:hypothetical protein